MDKQRHVITFLAFLSSIYIFVIAAFFIYAIFGNYMPFDNIEYVVNNFDMPLYYFLPEKAEKIQYFSLVFGFPILYTIFFKVWTNVKLNITENIYKTVQIIEVAATIFLTLFLYKESVFRHNFFFTLINNKIEILITSIVFFLLLFFYQKGKDKTRNILKILISCIFLYGLVIVGQIYQTPVYDITASCRHHFIAYFSPIYKVLSGLTIGIDFENIYGFYPYIYELILKPFKVITISKISFINTCLIISSLIFTAITIAINVKNKILGFVFILSYIYYFYIFSILSNLETIYYLQFMPHRIFFITLIILLASIYSLDIKPNYQKLIEIINAIILTIALIWNFESGIVATLSWYGFILYQELINYKKSTSNYKTIIYKLLPIFLVLFFALTIIETITFTKAGKFLSLTDLFLYQNLFYKTGFFMLPMPLFQQPWILIILIYLIGLMKSINNIFFEKEMDKKYAIYFILSLIGLGIFAYYQGRSHILILGSVSFPALILLCLFCNEFIENFSQEKTDKFIKSINITKLILIFAIISAVASSGFDMLFISPFSKQLNQLKQQIKQNGPAKKNIDFIKSNTQEAENLDILTADSDILYLELNKKDMLPFAPTSDWGAKSQYEKVFKYLKNSKNTLIIDDEIFKKIQENEKQNLQELLKTKKYKLKNAMNNGLNTIFIYEQ